VAHLAALSNPDLHTHLPLRVDRHGPRELGSLQDRKRNQVLQRDRGRWQEQRPRQSEAAHNRSLKAVAASERVGQLRQGQLGRTASCRFVQIRRFQPRDGSVAPHRRRATPCCSPEAPCRASTWGVPQFRGRAPSAASNGMRPPSHGRSSAPGQWSRNALKRSPVSLAA
jgi:hypothetical protein